MRLRAGRVSLAALFDVDWLMHNLEHIKFILLISENGN